MEGEPSVEAVVVDRCVRFNLDEDVPSKENVVGVTIGVGGVGDSASRYESIRSFAMAASSVASDFAF